MATLQKVIRWLQEQPARDKESLTKLARRGWFLSPHMPVAAIPQLGKAAESMLNEVDEAVGQYFRRHLDDIEADLIATYPHRTQLLQEAFWAHRECKYSLSIKAFLEQADGIFYDGFGKPFFTKWGPGAVSQYSSRVTGRFLQAVLHPLTGSAPLWEDSRSRDNPFEGLNRHEVMHGMKVDYNTELNSLKAVSLLDNLGWVLNRHANGC